jgi:hypothetical protein
MGNTKRPAASESGRGGEIISGEMLPNTTVTPNAQRHRATPHRVVSWRVNRWLTVEVIEVRHG